MPFHSVETEEEAQALIDRHCHVAFRGKKLRHVVTRTWDFDDITEAMRSTARQFGLEPRKDNV